jgi:hypothetical protein
MVFNHELLPELLFQSQTGSKWELQITYNFFFILSFLLSSVKTKADFLPQLSGTIPQYSGSVLSGNIARKKKFSTGSQNLFEDKRETSSCASCKIYGQDVL